MWATVLSTPMPYARIESDYLLVDVVPFLGGRALRIIHRGTAECITAYDTVRNLYFPWSGGEETRTGGTANAEQGGPMAPFAVTEKADHSITLETDLPGFRLRRILTLAANAPVLSITNVLRNTTDKAGEARVRSHLELDLGELRQTRVAFTNRSGEAVQRDMQPIIAGLREGEHYRGGNTPSGAWTFTGSKGLQVTQTFDPAQVDFTWLYAYPDYLNELEVQVWAKPVPLGPGEIFTFSHQLTVRPVSGL